MKPMVLLGLAVFLMQPRTGHAEVFVDDVRVVWDAMEADETAAWSDEDVAAGKAMALRDRAKKGEGFTPLFGTDLTNAVFSRDAWAMTDDVLAPTGRGDIWTRERYGDFMLALDFKCATNSNSGVFLRCDDRVEWLHTAIEIQILQPEAANPRHNSGGVFDCMAPARRAIKPAGEWNQYLIVAEGPRILVLLNQELVLDMDLEAWTEAGRNPDGSPNKFKNAYRDMAREGHIGLQDHGQPIWFRNVRIKRL